MAASAKEKNVERLVILLQGEGLRDGAVAYIALVDKGEGKTTILNAFSTLKMEEDLYVFTVRLHSLDFEFRCRRQIVGTLDEEEAEWLTSLYDFYKPTVYVVGEVPEGY